MIDVQLQLFSFTVAGQLDGVLSPIIVLTTVVPEQLDGALSPIIVLATVMSLYIPFALSPDRRYLQYSGLVFHVQMIDVQTSNHKSSHMYNNIYIAHELKVITPF
jgi:hypothetical protein